MKNKGFVFVETIVVIVILTIGLVMVYASFSSVLTNGKRRATFNDVAYIYRTYYIEDFITSLDIENWVKYYLGDTVVDEAGNYISGGKKIQSFNCNNPNLYKIDRNINNNFVTIRDDEGKLDRDTIISALPASEAVKLTFCENLLNKYNVKNIYITNYEINDIKKCTTNGGKISVECDKNKAEYFNKFEAIYNMSTNMVYYLRTLSGKSEGDYRIIVEYEEEILDPDDSVSKVLIKGSYKCPDSYKENSEGVCQRRIVRNYYNNVKMVLKSKIK